MLMKVLESSAARYDWGMRLLSGGRMPAVHARVAALAEAGPGRRVLDLGCGTGGVALCCAARGAEVVGVDPNAEMLEVARAKEPPPEGSVEWRELGVAELRDRFPPGSFDALVSCLCFSELSPDERRYALRVARELVRPGGALVVADEVPPPGAAGALARLARLPLVALTWALTQTSTQALSGLAELVAEAGLLDVRCERPGAGLAIVSARVP